MKQILNSTNPFTTIMLWGIIGGLGLIFIAGKQHNAATVIPIFGTSLILSMATVKLARPNKIFIDLFITTLLTFTLIMLIDYVYIITVLTPGMLEVSLFGHLWRWAMVIGIGAGVSLVLTFLATLKK